VKRTGPLPRYTPLTGSAPLARSALGRNAGPKLPAQRRPKPAVPSRLRMELQGRSGGTCEIVLPGCGITAIDPAHRIKQGMGGRHGEAKVAHDVLSNLIHACRWCHSICHQQPNLAYRRGWMLREGQNPLEVPVLYRGLTRWLTGDGLVLDVCPL
jgi:hypothetical protein